MHIFMRTGKASVDAEMPRGKRIYPKTIYADPGKAYTLPAAVALAYSLIKPPDNRS